MRICVVNHYAAPRSAGAGTRHIDLAQAWAARGHEVTLVASSFDHFAGRQRDGAWTTRQHVADGVEFVQLRTPGYAGNDARRATDMLAFAARAATVRLPRHDVVIGSSPHLFAALAGLGRARRWRAPFVFEVRDLWPQVLIDLGGLRAGSVVARALYRLERLLVRRAAATVGIVPGLARYLSDRGLPADNVVHIPNGAPARTAEPAPGPAAQQAITTIDSLRGQARFVLLYAGAHGLANGLETLLDAAGLTAADGAHWVLMGDGPSKPELVRQAAARGLDNVTFLDPVPKTDVHAVLQRADAHVWHVRPAPAWRYGLSANKLVDYLASGRPLLYAGPAADNPIIDSGACVPAAAGDADDIARAARELAARSPDERAEMGRLGARHAATELSLDRLAERYLTVLEQAVQRRPTPAA